MELIINNARKLIVLSLKGIRGFLNSKKAGVRHLFLLSPPLSGSTLISELIGGSPAVTVFPRNIEGQFLPELRNILLVDNRWDPSLLVDWREVRRVFLRYWSPLKPIRFEKSPPHLVRANELEQHFEDAFFLITIRNPYAQIEGLLRRCWHFNEFGPQRTPAPPPTPSMAAAFWVRTAKHQLENMKTLKNVCFFRYEDLVGKTEETLEKIADFLPGIGQIDEKRQFDAHNVTGQPIYGIKNLNQEKIASLSPVQIAEINGVLEQHLDVLAYFQYEMIDGTYLKTKEGSDGNAMVMPPSI